MFSRRRFLQAGTVAAGSWHSRPFAVAREAEDCLVRCRRRSPL